MDRDGSLTRLFVAQYTLDVLQLHTAPHYERVPDGEDELAPNKLLRPNLW